MGKEMIEQMKKQDESQSKPSNLKIAGKKIGDIQAEDIEKFSLGELEKAREQQVTRDRQEKIRQRKLESKRVDHLSRAIREEENTMLGEWADQIEEEDIAFLNKASALDEQEQRKKHEEALAEKNMLIVFQSHKDAWMKQQLDARYKDHTEKVEAKLQKAMDKEAENKIERAIRRRDE